MSGNTMSSTAKARPSTATLAIMSSRNPVNTGPTDAPASANNASKAREPINMKPIPATNAADKRRALKNVHVILENAIVGSRS